MRTSAAQLKNSSFSAAILAWPHKSPRTSLTEPEVRDKVTTVLASGLGISPDQLQGSTLIKQEFDVDWYGLAGPIMTIENFFRTFLQEESEDDRISIDMIVDKLTGRSSRSTVH